MSPYDSPTSHSGIGLDSPPSAPPDRIKPSLAGPGDDTMSLLGAPNANGEDGLGASSMTPTGRALGGVMRMMEGANLIESVVPGAIPPQLLQLIQQLSITLPDIVRSMEQMPPTPSPMMTGPGGMLTGMGGNPMAVGGSPMGGAAGAPPGEGPQSGMPMF